LNKDFGPRALSEKKYLKIRGLINIDDSAEKSNFRRYITVVYKGDNRKKWSSLWYT